MHSFHLGLNSKIALSSSGVKMGLEAIAPYSHRFTLALKGDHSIEFWRENRVGSDRSTRYRVGASVSAEGIAIFYATFETKA